MANVMIVDDSRLARRMMRAILEEGGHTVIEAESGTRAIDQFLIDRPAVVMLDLLMRDMGGLEVLAQLRQKDPDVRVVIATADIQTSTRRLAEQAGACGLVEKPFAAREVLKAVEQALKQGAWHDEPK
jgi:two-component system, chemotaxis family, chemotaxis protein CheY